jgi:hypothetical protein
MNPNGISHRLFVAALAQDGQTAGKRPSPARMGGARGAVKNRQNAPSQPMGALTARRVPDWSWSGWQHTMI